MFKYFLILTIFSIPVLLNNFVITKEIIIDQLKVNNKEPLCLSTLTQADCAEDEVIIANGTDFGCPICSSTGKQVRDICETGECQYGLSCIDGTCDLDKSTCAYTYHLTRINNEEIARIDPKKLPTCEVDGTFAVVQCKGDHVTGRCFCYSSIGKRIYGWSWWHELVDNSMNCACSLYKYNLENTGQYGNTIHCDRMGNFEELQCNNGVCWCAEKLTGEIMNRTRAVPENMWKFLPCYNEKIHGDQYLRQCESIKNSQDILRKSLVAHGTTNVEFNNFMCDYDGSYGFVKTMDGKVYCQWTDGKNIGSFAAESKDYAKMGCLCARDQKIFQMAGLGHRLTCDGHGNYFPQQNINGKAFCVDKDGFAVNEAIETTEELKCQLYTYYEVKIEQETYYGLYEQDNNYDLYDENSAIYIDE